MLCQNCEKKEATTHIKQIINGDMSESHLCSECAKYLGANDMFSDFNRSFTDFFDNFFSDMLPAIGPSTTLRCKKCGSSFDDIVKTGKIGCADCYEAFYDKLLPSLQRIHGKIHHAGKIGTAASLSEEKEQNTAAEAEQAKENTEDKINRLKAEMEAAVKEQNFELAAKLRDEIKAVEGGQEQ